MTERGAISGGRRRNRGWVVPLGLVVCGAVVGMAGLLGNPGPPAPAPGTATGPASQPSSFPRTRPGAEAYLKDRQQMVRVLLSYHWPQVSDQRVIAAMGAVPRHRFVPDKYRSQAYDDTPLPIGSGQTISQPYIVALMSELLQTRPGDRVLEIGTGSGYQAAVLADMGCTVYTIEIFQELGTSAAGRLKGMGYENAEVKVADGYFGWKDHAPYDAIVVTCAATHVPPALIEQLKSGGRICVPVGPAFGTQDLVVVTKQPDGTVRSRSIIPVRFVPLVRTPQPPERD